MQDPFGSDVHSDQASNRKSTNHAAKLSSLLAPLRGAHLIEVFISKNTYICERTSSLAVRGLQHLTIRLGFNSPCEQIK